MKKVGNRLKIKRWDGFLLAVFYVVVGISEIVVLAFSNSTLMPPDIGALAILNLIAAYGLFKTKRWSVWLVIAIFFPQLTFAAITLYASYTFYALHPETSLILLNVALALLIVLSFISLVYVAAKRKTFQ
jgi:uncharacterized membrane protein (DUF2068 family)